MLFYNAHEEYRFYQRKQKKYEVMPNPKGKREKIMTEIKTNETINVFPCTFILISRAIRPLDHETITKICQQDEDFQKRVLDFLINICGSSVYTDIEFQDWSEYEPDKSSNGGCYRFSKHYYYNKDSDLWELQYETSADMEYCPICGHFGNHEEYDDDTFIGYSCGSAKIISSTKMIQTVISFMLNYKDDTDHIMLVR